MLQFDVTVCDFKIMETQKEKSKKAQKVKSPPCDFGDRKAFFSSGDY